MTYTDVRFLLAGGRKMARTMT
ncbi:type II toxin-antitoxin system ParD family antitoxin, partial [Escherichia coli]|nr:type II toxin-antitoxin system ParD family antitoxin [Escherichia coli]